MRAVILGEELLQLPVRFDALVVEQREFNTRTGERMDRMESDISEIRAGQVRLESDVTDLKAGQLRIESRMDRQERDMSTLKGMYVGSLARESAETLSRDLELEYVRTLGENELDLLIRNSRPDLPLSEIRSFRRADMVVEARDESGTVYIALEASFTGDVRDSYRAQRNARLLTEITGHRAIPVVASVRNVNEVAELVASGDIYWYEMEERGNTVE